MIDVDHVRFAAKLLELFVLERRIPWRTYNQLMRSVRWHQARLMDCATKQRFHTFAQANRVAKRRSRDGHHSRAPYHCCYCGFVHLRTCFSKVRVAHRVLRDRKREEGELDYA